MEIQLIKLKDKFILVSDEEIIPYLKYDKNNRITIVLHIPSNTIIECNGIGEMNGSKTIIYSDFLHGREVLYKECKLIIAGIPELSSIDFSLLSEKDRKKIGWYDVEKLCENNYPLLNVPEGSNIDWQFRLGQREGYSKGFKEAQSLNDKRFSLEDMRKALWELGDVLFNNNQDGIKEGEPEIYFDSIIQSLQQTSWDVEVKMECGEERQCECMDNIYCLKPQPKITNNSIKLLRIL